MPQTDTRSLQQIKRETEQTRAGLTDTVEQLRTSVAETASDIRQRISPNAIKAEVSDYIKSRGERLVMTSLPPPAGIRCKLWLSEQASHIHCCGWRELYPCRY